MKEFYLDSCGGGRLHCAIWTPEGEPKAVVQLIHGIAEHIGRYDEFARFLNAHGYVVAADDHMGHSMGSFLLRTYLYTYPDAVDKAVISGTGWEDPTKVRLGKLVCKLEQARVGETSTSKLVTKLMFGSYNKPFGAVTSPNAWICSDEAVVAAYDADPLCGFDATVGLARDLLTGVEMNEQPENLDKMNKQLPLLFVSGSKDPVGGMAKGVLRCIDAFKRSGMKDITIKLYPEGRHEMLNERNKAEVYQDILDWLER